jgi:hypothetical protein
LQRGKGAVVGQLFASVFCFCARRKNFDDQGGILDEVSSVEIAGDADDDDVWVIVGAGAADL